MSRIQVHSTDVEEKHDIIDLGGRGGGHHSQKEEDEAELKREMQVLELKHNLMCLRDERSNVVSDVFIC